MAKAAPFLCALMVAAVASIAAPAAASATTTPGLTVVDRGYRYASSGPLQHLTVTYGPHRKAAPWVMLVHGGSWFNGGRADEAAAATEFARYGWQVFNVDYSRGTGVTPGDQISDLRAARRFIEAHYGQYALNPAAGTLFGFSAGGHLVTLLSAMDHDPDVHGVVTVDGILEPDQIAEQALGLLPGVDATPDVTWLYGQEAALLKCQFPGPDSEGTGGGGACDDAWTSFLPATYASAGGPAYYVVNGTADPVNPYQTAASFVNLVQQRGGSAVLTLAEGGGHTQTNVLDHGRREYAMRAWIVSQLRSPNR